MGPDSTSTEEKPLDMGRGSPRDIFSGLDEPPSESDDQMF